MRTIPVDFANSMATSSGNGDAQVTLLTLKMPSGDLFLSDWQWGTAHGLAKDYQPIIENISEEKDGGGISTLLSPGNLETGSMTVNLIFSDQTRALIFSLMQEGLDRRRVEVWKWFARLDPGTGLWSGSCDPMLHNIFFVQDNSTGKKARENDMLFPIELITATASENRKLSITNDPDKSYDYVIGRATGMRLQLMDDESSPWTELLDDLDASVIGLVRVKDSTLFQVSGTILVNGEKMDYSEKSAGYFKLSTRAAGGTEAQEHRSGSRIFPDSSTFKYAVCIGPVGSLELLRTSNDLDTYDDDGDLDTDEYRNLYTGGNEVLHPELNPAQVWFSGRMPWLKEAQNFTIVDKVFYGNIFSFSSAEYCRDQHEINKPDGKASIIIPFRGFSASAGTEVGYLGTELYLPSNQGAGPTFQASENIINGKFTVTSHHGDFATGDAYTEFRATGAAEEIDEGYMDVGVIRPATEEFYSFTGIVKPGIGFNAVRCHYMEIDIGIFKITPDGTEVLWNHWLSVGSELSSTSPYPHGWWYFEPPVTGVTDIGANVRFRMKITVKGKKDNNSYAYIRIGMTIGGQEYYNMSLGWQYYKVEPTASITSHFIKNLWQKGTFTSAKAVITGTMKNTAGKATGDLVIIENGTDKSTIPISEGGEVDEEITLTATTWAELALTEIKIELRLTALTGEITEGEAGINLSDGVKWLISYESDNLDGVQVQYTDNLLVDAISTHGENPTPPQQVQYLMEDFTNYQDLIDSADFTARHAEYQTAGHYLNGTIAGSSRVQDALKKILSEGFARFNHTQGKIKLLTYITDSAATPVGTVDRYNFSPESGSKRGAGLTPKEKVSNRMFFWWKKNLTTGKYDGSVVKSEGSDFLNDLQFRFDLVDSDSACNKMAAYLFDLSKKQLIEVDSSDVMAGAYQYEKGDVINYLDMMNNNTLDEFVILSAKIVNESAKLNRQCTINLSLFKKLQDT